MRAPFRRSFENWKFQNQLMLFFGTAVLVFALIGASATSWLASDLFLRQMVEQGRQIASGFSRQSALAVLSGLGENAKGAAQATLGFPAVSFVAVHELGGTALLHEGKAPNWHPRAADVPHEASLMHENEHLLHFVAPVRYTPDATGSPFDLERADAQVLGFVHVVVDKDELLAARNAIFRDNFLSIFLSAAGLLALLLALTRRLTRPLNHLASLMGLAEHGERGVRAPTRGPEEVRNMARAFNKMMDVLEQRALDLDRQNAMLLKEMDERRLAEQGLRDSGARLRAVIEHAVDGILTVDGDGIIEMANPALFRTFGYCEAELVGRPLSMLLENEQAQSDPDYVGRYLRPGPLCIVGAGSREIEGRRKGGESFSLDLTVGEIQLGSGRRFVAIMRDITERKRAQLQLIAYRDHLQDMVEERTRDLKEARDRALVAERAMSVFLANMSHELRTPLHGVLSYARFGIEKSARATPDKLLRYFTEIRDSGERLLELLNDLLDLSKLRSGKMTYEYAVVAADQIIRSVVQEFSALAEQREIQLCTAGVAGHVCVRADSGRIAQVIRNLLSNAIKFSSPGGRVTITLCRDAENVEMRVQDEGMGIPDAELEYIFDAFTQSSKTRTNAGGTGLGLPICKEIVEAGHGGRIWARNLETGGACFTVVLPAA